MTNFTSLVCIQMEIEGIEVCHFHWELFWIWKVCNAEFSVSSKKSNKDNHREQKSGIIKIFIWWVQALFSENICVWWNQLTHTINGTAKLTISSVLVRCLSVFFPYLKEKIKKIRTQNTRHDRLCWEMSMPLFRLIIVYAKWKLLSCVCFGKEIIQRRHFKKLCFLCLSQSSKWFQKIPKGSPKTLSYSNLMYKKS